MLFISPLLISYTHTMLLLTCPFKVPLLSFVKDSFLLPPFFLFFLPHGLPGSGCQEVKKE
jgi:hypothetical protein